MKSLRNIAAFLVVSCGQSFAAEPSRPNIILINADDLGYGDVGCYGATRVETPNIDRLAAEGRRFTDAHSVSAVCTPSRYSLLTGEYAWRKNIWSPVFHTAGLLIGTEQMTVARLLQQQGYVTACVGKWHLGFKFGAWEGGHRVPFIARWPGKVPAGFESSQLIANVDLLHTFAALLQVNLPAGAGRDSLDVLPALLGEPTKPVRGAVVLAPHQRANLALRSGPWVYIGSQGSGGFGNGLGEIAFAGQINSDVDRQGRIRPDAPQTQLYNLHTDPRQQRNVLHEHPEVAAELQAQLDALRAKD